MVLLPQEIRVAEGADVTSTVTDLELLKVELALIKEKQ